MALFFCLLINDSMLSLIYKVNKNNTGCFIMKKLKLKIN